MGLEASSLLQIYYECEDPCLPCQVKIRAKLGLATCLIHLRMCSPAAKQTAARNVCCRKREGACYTK